MRSHITINIRSHQRALILLSFLKYKGYICTFFGDSRGQYFIRTNCEFLLVKKYEKELSWLIQEAEERYFAERQK